MTRVVDDFWLVVTDYRHTAHGDKEIASTGDGPGNVIAEAWLGTKTSSHAGCLTHLWAAMQSWSLASRRALLTPFNFLLYRFTIYSHLCVWYILSGVYIIPKIYCYQQMKEESLSASFRVNVCVHHKMTFDAMASTIKYLWSDEYVLVAGWVNTDNTTPVHSIFGEPEDLMWNITSAVSISDTYYIFFWSPWQRCKLLQCCKAYWY